MLADVMGSHTLLMDNHPHRSAAATSGVSIGCGKLLLITCRSAKQALLKYRSDSSATICNICFVSVLSWFAVDIQTGRAPSMVSFRPSATRSDKLERINWDLSTPSSCLNLSPAHRMEHPVSAIPSRVTVFPFFGTSPFLGPCNF